MAKPLKGLGRGLDSLLLGADLAQREPSVEVPQSLPIEVLRPGKYQPRAGMDPQALNELAESIKAQGILQPILVRPIGAGQYEIIAGERRWRAARIAGLAPIGRTKIGCKIPCALMDSANSFSACGSMPARG